jgi:Fe2+ or Zn2+ uptake regulation protein
MNHTLCATEAFQQAFPNDTVPNKTTIYRIITMFEETGCVCVIENITAVAPS